MDYITVGIPVFNEQEYLHRTIQSLVNQKMKNWKAIISDNCSTDNTYEIACELSLKDSRISVYKQEKKMPAGENFNFSLEKARSKYFVWLGGHDLFNENYLQMGLDVLEKNTQIVMAYPKAQYIDKDDNSFGSADSDIDSKGLSRKERMCKIARNLSICTAIHGIFRRDILLKSPFKSIIGPDHLILFSASSYGEFYELPFVGIMRRETRKESYEEKKLRWIKEGVFDTKKNVKPHSYMVLEFLKFIVAAKHLRCSEKAHLVLNIKRAFKKKYNINVIDIVRAIRTGN